MKYFVIFCSVVLAVYANSIQDKWNRVHQDCQSNPALHVDDRIFEDLKRGGNPTLPANFGQHANCMMIGLDMQDNSGHVRQDGVREAAQRSVSDSSKVNQIVQECSVNKESKEKTALALFGCLGKHHVDIGQF